MLSLRHGGSCHKSLQVDLAIPLVYLLVNAPQLERPALYYLQIGLMVAWLLVEALLDYILKLDFRQVRWMVISYTVNGQRVRMGRSEIPT
jgi:hypothetical protein